MDISNIRPPLQALYGPPVPPSLPSIIFSFISYLITPSLFIIIGAVSLLAGAVIYFTKRDK